MYGSEWTRSRKMETKHLFNSHWFSDGRPRDDFGKMLIIDIRFTINVKIQLKEQYMFSWT